jgi:hypothetical protein
MTTVLPFMSNLTCSMPRICRSAIYGIHSLDRVKGTKPTRVMERVRVSLGAIFSITVSCYGAWAGVYFASPIDQFIEEIAGWRVTICRPNHAPSLAINYAGLAAGDRSRRDSPVI